MSGSDEWGRPAGGPASGYPDPRDPVADPFVAPSRPGFGAPPAASGAPFPTTSGPLIPPSDAPSGGSIAALVLAVLGALVGIAVGWGFPLSIVALVLALTSRGASRASRRLSVWSVSLVIVSAVGSVAWLVYSIVYLLG